MCSMQSDKDKPLVSVVLCTYNTEKYIAEALESVLAQTYTNFEFIIWDDGSTDGTKSIVDSFKDKRIKYFFHENTGLGMALRLACEKASGKYIARMDSDDVCLPERFEKEIAYLELHQDVVLVSSAVKYINEDGVVMGRSFPYTNDKVIKSALLIPSSFIVHPMAMIRKDAYERAGGYLPIKKSQDVLFWSRLAKEGKFHNISTPLGKYRILNTSLDHAFNPYSNVISSLLLKMVKDDTVKESDIEVYNQLYQYSRKFTAKAVSAAGIEIGKTSEEKVFDLLRTIMGASMAEEMVSGFKDFLYKIKKVRR